MTTFYLSFDVGIKNLAYCFSSYNKNLTILDWNIINFSQEHAKCNQINKKKICGKKAQYHNENKTNSYCEIHHKTKNEKVKKIPSSTLLFQIEKLINALDNLFENTLNLPCDNFKYPNKINILIENQPVFLIPTMKTYSIVIYTYFAHKKIHYPNFINDVRFINAIVKTSNKFILKINKSLNINNILFEQFKINYIDKYTKIHKQNLKKNKNTKIKKIKSYDIRKEFSIDFTFNIINNIKCNYSNVISITRFELEKKKDDLADALLYILYSIYM